MLLKYFSGRLLAEQISFWFIIYLTHRDSNLEINAGIEIPKYVDTVTPEYKPKFDALVSSHCSHTFFFFEN